MNWTGVKEQLPDKDCLVLVTDGRHVTLANWTKADGWVLDREDRAVGITANVISHWMPLPEPPAAAQYES